MFLYVAYQQFMFAELSELSQINFNLTILIILTRINNFDEILTYNFHSSIFIRWKNTSRTALPPGGGVTRGVRGSPPKGRHTH